MNRHRPDVNDPPGALVRLHARYDGEIPKSLRVAARAGGALARDRLKAEARRRMFDALARDALRAIARRRLRMPGGESANDRTLGLLARDLRFYRDRGVARGRG
jgi:hypothetical protein